MILGFKTRGGVGGIMVLTYRTRGDTFGDILNRGKAKMKPLDMNKTRNVIKSNQTENDMLCVFFSSSE